MKNYSKLIMFFLLLNLGLTLFAQPDNNIIKKNVTEYYNSYSQMIGGASYNINKIIIDKIEHGYNDTFVVIVKVKGTTKNYTIANDKRRKFTQKLEFKYFKSKHNEWDYIIENDPRQRKNQ